MRLRQPGGGVQGFAPLWLECFFGSILVLDVEPHTQGVFVPGVIVFVAGQLDCGCNVVP